MEQRSVRAPVPSAPDGKSLHAPNGPLAFTSVLPREAESAGHARRLSAAALAAWNLSAMADAAALVISELVGNAVAHAAGPTIEVTVTRPRGDHVRLAVTDRASGNAALVAARTADTDSEHGRGLAIVEALSDRWDSTPLPHGKQVWAELAAEH